jgi:hypothetical protein
MSDPFQTLFQLARQNTVHFAPNSRYYGIETSKLETRDGRTVVFVRRRFIPPPERYAGVVEHTVTEGERIDLIAARYLRDPERFWLICDANAATDPAELVATPGRRIRITLPAGVPGVKSE